MTRRRWFNSCCLLLIAGALVDGTSTSYPITAAPFATSPDWSVTTNEGPSAGFGFGSAVANAGDVNGDGYDDVIVGSGNYAFSRGKVWLFHGSATGLMTTPAFTAVGNEEGVSFGWSVGTAGDVNGDGYDDVIIGAPNYSENSPPPTSSQGAEGAVWVHYGSAAGLVSPAAFMAVGHQPRALFGWSVARAGDVNADGYDDVIIGSPFSDRGHEGNSFMAQRGIEGEIWVYHGSATGLGRRAAFTARADQLFTAFGHGVASAGDVNGDGFDDVIVTAPGNTERVFVYHGSPSGLTLPAAFVAENDQPFSLFGQSARSAGDVNGDGYADVIVGAPFYTNGEDSEGRVYVYHGSPNGLLPVPAFTAESNQVDAWYGFAVAGAGDVDADGYDDVILGAPRYSNGQTREGVVWIHHGSPAGVLSAASFTAERDQARAGYGRPVARAGDVNGDGFADVIIGSSLYNNGPLISSGRVDVYHGPR